MNKIIHWMGIIPSYYERRNLKRLCVYLEKMTTIYPIIFGDKTIEHIDKLIVQLKEEIHKGGLTWSVVECILNNDKDDIRNVLSEENIRINKSILSVRRVRSNSI
jgi:D-mannonate dehydratase